MDLFEETGRSLFLSRLIGSSEVRSFNKQKTGKNLIKKTKKLLKSKEKQPESLEAKYKEIQIND